MWRAGSDESGKGPVWILPHRADRTSSSAESSSLCDNSSFSSDTSSRHPIASSSSHSTSSLPILLSQPIALSLHHFQQNNQLFTESFTTIVCNAAEQNSLPAHLPSFPPIPQHLLFPTPSWYSGKKHPFASLAIIAAAYALIRHPTGSSSQPLLGNLEQVAAAVLAGLVGLELPVRVQLCRRPEVGEILRTPDGTFLVIEPTSGHGISLWYASFFIFYHPNLLIPLLSYLFSFSPLSPPLLSSTREYLLRERVLEYGGIILSYAAIKNKLLWLKENKAMNNIYKISSNKYVDPDGVWTAFGHYINAPNRKGLSETNNCTVCHLLLLVYSQSSSLSRLFAATIHIFRQ